MYNPRKPVHPQCNKWHKLLTITKYIIGEHSKRSYTVTGIQVIWLLENSSEKTLTFKLLVNELFLSDYHYGGLLRWVVSRWTRRDRVVLAPDVVKFEGVTHSQVAHEWHRHEFITYWVSLCSKVDWEIRLSWHSSKDPTLILLPWDVTTVVLSSLLLVV